MPIDAELQSDLGTTWNEVGDIANVTGAAAIRQEITTTILAEADLSAPPLTEGAIESQRSTIEQAIRENPQSQPPVRVDVVNIDYDAETIDYEIQTNRVSLPLTVN